MILKESIVIDHLGDESWLNQSKTLILKSIRTYSQATIDSLCDYEQFQTYIIKNNLYSERAKKEIIDSAPDLGQAPFRHLCSLLPEKDVELLYEKTMDKNNPSHHGNYCAMWYLRPEVLVKDAKKRMELFIHTYEYAGRSGMTKLMKHVICKYPKLLNAWIGYDTAKVVRFYSDIGRLIKFDDESMDLLINSLSDKEKINQEKLVQMLKSIVARNNCSKLKKAEVLFSLS